MLTTHGRRLDNMWLKIFMSHCRSMPNFFSLHFLYQHHNPEIASHLLSVAIFLGLRGYLLNLLPNQIYSYCFILFMIYYKKTFFLSILFPKLITCLLTFLTVRARPQNLTKITIEHDKHSFGLFLPISNVAPALRSTTCSPAMTSWLSWWGSQTNGNFGWIFFYFNSYK